MDKIFIDRLHVECIIGTNPDERLKKQELFISVCLGVDTKGACAGDDLNLAVNYFAVAEEITARISESRFFLIETCASRVADICRSFDGVLSAEVTVEKPQAIHNADNVRVWISR